jgi:hypothetical protein
MTNVNARVSIAFDTQACQQRNCVLAGFAEAVLRVAGDGNDGAGKRKFVDNTGLPWPERGGIEARGSCPHGGTVRVHEIVRPFIANMWEIQFGLTLEQKLKHPRRGERQFLDPFSGGVRHRAGDCRADVQNRDFARAFCAQWSDGRRAFVKADRHWQRIERKRHTVGLEIVLTDPAIGADTHLLMQGIAKSLHDTALNLTADGARIERAADILNDAIAQHLDMAGIAVNCYFAVVNRKYWNVDRIDEMTGGASGLGRRTASGEAAGAHNRPDRCLGVAGNFGDGEA